MTTRPGYEVRMSECSSRLVPFDINPVEQCLVEFSDRAVRVWAGGVLMPIAGAATSIETPWDEAAIFDLKFVQFGDSLLVSRPREPLRELERSKSGEWSLRPAFAGSED